VHGKLSMLNQTSREWTDLRAGNRFRASAVRCISISRRARRRPLFAASPSRPFRRHTNQYGLGRGILFAYDLVDTP